MTCMQPNSSFAEHDASSFVKARATQPSAAQFIVKNHERLPVVVLAQPFFDSLVSRASAVLWRVPNVMQQVSNHAEASVLKQSDECVSFHLPEPICRYNDVGAVFINDAEERLRCRRMPKPLPQIDRPLSIFLKNILAAVGFVQAQNVVEIQK